MEPAENVGKRTAWLCRCACGREVVVTTRRLRDGHRTSCGCDDPHFGEPLNKKLELTGQKFGKLTVLGVAEHVGERTAWLCRCGCGQEVVVTTQQLRAGHWTSCGCDKPYFGETPAVIGRASLTFVDGTCVEMIRANTRRRNNTSGTPGVDWMPSKGRWRASICFKGTRRYLGSYGKLEDAVKARKRAEEELFEPFVRQYDAPREAVNG